MSPLAGAVVANIYYAQPLLPSIAKTFHVSAPTAALVVTAAQVGYGGRLQRDPREDSRLLTIAE